MEKNQRFKNFINNLPTYFLYFGIIILLVDQFIRKFFLYSILENYNLHLTIGIAVIGLLAFTLNKKIDFLKKEIERFTNQYSGVLEVLPSNHTISFIDLVSQCQLIRILTLSGTKLGELGDTRLKSMLQSLPSNTKVTILLGNPFSKNIIERYEKDEPENYETGLEGINRRLVFLYTLFKEIPKTKKKNITIKVFDNYPTLSILQADDDLYSANYGYKLRGGDCPKIHSKTNGDYGDFLLKHFNMVQSNADTLENWYQSNHNKKDNP